MLSPRQILLARTMLGLNQGEMAQKLGVSTPTYSRLEEGGGDAKTSVVKKLQDFYEGEGIEFLDGDGLRMRQVQVFNYDGADGFRAFMDDVYYTARDTGGEFILFNGVPNMLQKWLGKDWYKQHAARMAEIKDRIRFKVTIREGDTNFIGSAFAKYRWFPEGLSSDKTIYVYGDKIGFLDFGDSVKVTVLKQKDFADAMRVLFNVAWDHVAQDIVV